MSQKNSGSKNNGKKVDEKARPITKSERLLLDIGNLVECDVCHKQVTMSRRWMLTAKKDVYGKWTDKRAVCPDCQKAVYDSGEILISI
jgi:hypothetical protein